MQLGTSRKSGRLRNRLVVGGIAALAGGTAWVAATRRPQLPQPAAEPPRLGHAVEATGGDPAAVDAG
ncbi:hypothetical protein [Nocardia vermiculata]|uniref:Uncharacterized protein n=1 Tax=Nocardia vermiculata TaxID=257274 RepID=A0A846Y001_9NOCA|nr:hypothetical protein [Nocardia vermiculata]NKY49869.1 hypothetical protein [Nocardia vermiculata]